MISDYSTLGCSQHSGTPKLVFFLKVSEAKVKRAPKNHPAMFNQLKFPGPERWANLEMLRSCFQQETIYWAQIVRIWLRGALAS